MPALPDGLYRVTTRTLCAGFVVTGGRVTACAPILRRHLAHWMRPGARHALEPIHVDHPPKGV